MSKDNEISATEKLLEMIRGEQSADQLPSTDSEMGIKLSANDHQAPSLSGLSLESDAPPEIAVDPPTIQTAANSFEKIAVSPETKAKTKVISSEKRFKFVSTLAAFKEKIPTFGKSSKTIIGIDLQEESINIAVLPSTPKTIYRESFSSIRIPTLEGDNPRCKDPEFIQFLKKQIVGSCSNASKAEIWCSPNTEKAEILTIIIPKVPKKEIANAVFWSTKKETEYDMNEYIFDFSVRREISEGKLKKIITTVYLLPKKVLNDIKTLFHKSGINLTGITLPSSAIENLAKNDFLPDCQETSVHLSLEREIAHIDIYHQGSMLFTRKIKTGINSIVEPIFDKAAEQDLFLDDQSAVNLIFDNTKSSLYQSDKKDTPELNELAGLLNPNNLPVTSRLSRQLNRTFDYCSTHFKVPRASCLLTSGPYTLKKSQLNILETDLDISCNVINVQQNTPEISATIPADIPDEINPTAAYGLAMSSNDNTQNFLYTFADKKNFRQETRINQVIALVTILLSLVCGTFFFVQYKIIKDKENTLQQLTVNLEKQLLLEPRSRDAAFSEMASKKIELLLEKNNKTAHRFQPMAAISNILDNIPPEIRVTNLFIGPPPKESSAHSNTSNFLKMEGVISGIPEKQNFILLDFQKRLYNLPLVKDAKIANNESKDYEGVEVLYFTIITHTSRDIF